MISNFQNYALETFKKLMELNVPLQVQNVGLIA